MRDGFTMVELIVAVVVAGILGTALTRLLVNDSRFVARQEADLSARRTARSALNWAAMELRMVGPEGVRVATPESVTVRIPFAFGIACGRVSGDEILSLMPSDSLSTATAVADGFAWRRSDGTYQFDTSVGVVASTDSTPCLTDSIRVVPGGRLVAVSGIPSGVPYQPPPGSLAYIYHRVTYKFAPSVDVPGRLGFWRQAYTQAYEELAAPFDTSSGFGFLTDATADAQDTPPADLSDIQGLELRLVGESEDIPRQATTPAEFPLVSQIRFMNWF